MKISIEKLTELIVREVIIILIQKGYRLDPSSSKNNNLKQSAFSEHKQLVIDMSSYKTPVVTENHLSSIAAEIKEIIIPEQTIITPGAKQIIKNKQLIVSHSNKGE